MSREAEMEGPSRGRLDRLLHHLCPRTPAYYPQNMVYACSQPCSSLCAPVVVGAMVLDIHASPFSNELTSGTTTPGRVRYNRGGVARNVAECMSKLGMVPFLISVVGKDMAGDILLKDWHSLGLATDGIRQCPGLSTPVVSAIFDGNGELDRAVADTHIIEQHLTPEWIGQFGAVIRSAPFLMLDANLNPAALEAACKLAKGANVPIWFEPVSVSKSVRYSSISNYIDYVSPNEAELVAMGAVGTKLEKIPLNALKSDDSEVTVQALIQHLQPHFLVLLQRGVTYIVLTAGRHGVLLCSEACNVKNCCNWNQKTLTCGDVDLSSRKPPQIYLEHSSRYVGQDFQSWDSADDALSSHIAGHADSSAQFRSIDICYMHFPALPASIMSLSGAGDCFVAGALTGLCLDKDKCSSMAYGVAVARQAIQSELNVPSHFSYSNLRADAKLVLASATQIPEKVCPRP